MLETTNEDRQTATVTRGADPEEERLVRRARAGDPRAYGELVRRHQGAAHRVAVAVLGTTDGADDVVQHALERAWRSVDQFEVGRPFGPWLLRIVANLARNDRRSRGRRARLADRVAGPGGDAGTAVLTPEDLVLAGHDRAQVVEALNRLDRDDRWVIALRYVDGLSEREMAEVMSCPRGTVKSRLSRAMGRLRSQLVVWTVLVVLVAALVVTPVREAVADLLRLGSTVVELVPGQDADPAGLPQITDEAESIGRDQAEQLLGGPLPQVSDPRLGDPELLTAPAAGGVILAWETGSTTLWVRPFSREEGQTTKALAMDDPSVGVEPVDDLGRQAILVRGDHVLITPQRRYGASTVVLWLAGPWEHRLESDLAPEVMVEIARSVAPQP